MLPKELELESRYDGTTITFEAHTDWEGSFLEGVAAAVLYGPKVGTKLRMEGVSPETAAMLFEVSLCQTDSLGSSPQGRL